MPATGNTAMARAKPIYRRKLVEISGGMFRFKLNFTRKNANLTLDSMPWLAQHEITGGWAGGLRISYPYLSFKNCR
jgi:hypothetical protein